MGITLTFKALYSYSDFIWCKLIFFYKFLAYSISLFLCLLCNFCQQALSAYVGWFWKLFFITTWSSVLCPSFYAFYCTGQPSPETCRMSTILDNAIKLWPVSQTNSWIRVDSTNPNVRPTLYTRNNKCRTVINLLRNKHNIFFFRVCSLPQKVSNFSTISKAKNGQLLSGGIHLYNIIIF
jgi:hypothetical protein